MFSRRFLLFCIAPAVFSISNSLQAQNLIQVYEHAKSYSPDFQVKQYAMDVIHNQADITKSGYYPNVDFDVSYSRTWQEVLRSDAGVFPVEETDYPTTKFVLTVNQKIYDAGLLDRIKKTDYELNQGGLQLQSAEQELIYNVIENYFLVLAAQDQLSLSQAEVAAIQSEYDLTKAKYEKGLVNILEWHEIQARFAEINATVSEAQLGLHSAKYQLKQLTGISYSELAGLGLGFSNQGFVNLKDFDWLDKSLQNNLDVQAQRQAVEVAKTEVSAQRKTYYPSVDLTLSASRDDAEGSLYGGGNKIDNYQAKLSVKVPIYQGGIRNAAIEESIKQQSIQEQVLKQMERETETEVETSLHSIQTNLIKIDALKVSEKSYQLALDAKRSGYQSGLFTSVDVLDAESKLYFAKKQLSDALYQLILSYAKLKQMAGELNLTELEKIQVWLEQ